VLNERDCEPPLPEAEVRKAARSAWEIQTTGRNWVGRERGVKVSATDLAALADEPCAHFLLCKLRLEHEGLRGTFAASAKAMAQARVLEGWTVHRYREALLVLVDRGFLAVAHQGGERRGDPRLFSFPDRAGMMGAGFAPNTNRTPSSVPGPTAPLPARVSEAPAPPRRKAA
jgi:hypothetical protein